MSFLSRLGLDFTVDAIAGIARADSTALIPSLSGDVSQVASLPTEIAQAFGINSEVDHVTRAQAMTIPAVRQGRNVIAGKIGTAPLVCTRVRAGRAPERVDRPYLSQPDPNCTRAALLTWTVDDLIFHGVAYWVVTARDAQGFPSASVRVEPSRISLNYADSTLRLDGKPIAPRDVIAFQGPDEGLLRHGATTLKTCLLLEAAVRRTASADVPVGIFEDSLGQLLDDEVDAFLSSWEAARQKRSTGYVPNGLKYVNPMADPEKLQLKDARAFQAAEVARHLNLPAYAINAPTNDALTYSTTEGNRRDLVEITFAPYIAAIDHRLSLGDVTPVGTAVALDFTAFVRADLAGTITTGAAAIAAGIMTADEVRVMWLNLPPLPATTPTEEAPDGQ